MTVFTINQTKPVDQQIETRWSRMSTSEERRFWLERWKWSETLERASSKQQMERPASRANRPFQIERNSRCLNRATWNISPHIPVSRTKRKRYKQQKESKGHALHEETCVCSEEDIYLSIINSIQLQLPVKPMETKLESHANEFLVGDRRCFPAWGWNIPSFCNRISRFEAFCALAMKTLNNQNISSLFWFPCKQTALV